MKKNVWIFNHYANTPRTGAFLRHYNFSKYLMRKGYNVRVFSASSAHGPGENLIRGNTLYYDDDGCGVPFTYIKTGDYTGNGPKRILNICAYYFRLIRVARLLTPPDIIIASSAPLSTCHAGIKIAKLFKIPCICELRDLWPESIVEYYRINPGNIFIKCLYRLEKWIYRHADGLIFTMPGGLNYIRDKGWANAVDVSKARHINNGVDLPQFYSDAAQWVFPDADLDNGALFKVVYTGAIRKVNAVEDLVAVAKALNDAKSGAKLLIWGAGNRAKDVRAAIRQLGLTNIVLKGNVEKRFIPGILKRADINLLHWRQTDIMRYGMSANKLFDYFAAGKPIVSDVSVPPEYDLIERYRCGAVTPNQSPETVAGAIAKMERCSKERRAQYRDAALTAARAYDFSRLTDELIAIIEAVEYGG
ncbi:MAG: glycosyltransferase family 4 protein [Clostridiales bacterium]|jgi:glycosyltransferase involved in cell wall biosynthesis|nr:glycosyltransferase family 4 protein [Clostridiales bacterium]